MDTKKLKLWWLLIVVPFFFGCPWNDECFGDLGSEYVDGLMVLSPLQDTFKIGDVVVFEVIIPDSFYFGDNKISLIGETSDEKPMMWITQGLGEDYNDFFNNDILISKGDRVKDKNTFRLHFCFESHKYKLKIQVNLNIKGKYRFRSYDRINFGSHKNCNSYSIYTNVNGTTGDWLEFIVIE